MKKDWSWGYSLCCTEPHQYRKRKSIVGFVSGLALGYILYLLILNDLGFGPEATLILSLFISLCLGVGNALSTQIRCITLLTIPAFCGKTGRNVLKTFVLAYVLAGPFGNLAMNAKEVIRVFGCSSSLTYNLTKTRYDLMVKPYQDALMNLKYDAAEAEEALSTVQKLVEPVVEEVEGEEEVEKIRMETDYVDDLQGDSHRSDEIENKFKTKSKRDSSSESSKGNFYEEKYRKKMEYRCDDVINKGTERCRSLFAAAHDSCYATVSSLVSWLLCWPMKLTFICNLASGKSLCDPSGAVEAGFGEGYAAVKRFKEDFKEEVKDVKLQYKVKNLIPQVQVASVGDVARSIMKIFDNKKETFDVILLVVRRLLTLTFLTIVCKAQNFHDRYLSDLEFDNHYLTSYFKHIDARRKNRNQVTLLPLKKIERQKLREPRAVLPGKEERWKILLHVVQLMVEMFFVASFFALDWLFTETLAVIAKHSYIEYTQQGHHDIELHIRGTGMLARVIRSIVRGFNVKRRVHVVHTNKACLPRATLLSGYYLSKVSTLYLFIFLFVILESYTLRLNRLICSYFYRKREKQRIIFLYNETLKRRTKFLRHMRVKVRRQAKENKLAIQVNWLLAMRLRHQKLLNWLRYLPVGKRQCIVCEEPEPTSPSKFHECCTEYCGLIYCIECWKDMGSRCYGCTTADEDQDTDLEDFDFVQ